MRSLTIATDADDCLWDLCGAWINYLNKEYGTKVCIEDIEEWDIKKAFPNLTTDEVFAPLFDRYMWEDVLPIGGAVETIKKLKEDGHRVVICTNSHYLALVHKMQTVFRYFKPVFSYDDVIVTKHKELIKCDLLIDDNPNNLLKQKQGLLFTRSHNLLFPTEDYKNIERVNSWEEIYNFVKEMEK